ncbi:MAG: hypothetical protein EXR62_06280 [Chloroflexi bacterium]|nr:hypothetical protein [Chloroflexota bacterium]
MASPKQPHAIHLVGSVPLQSAAEVFRTVCDILGARLQRLPDGETGARTSWINWQYGVLMNQPQLEPVPPDPHKYAPLPQVQLRSPLPPGEIQIGPLGYAAAAIESYAIFAGLKQSGAIPASLRFQVSLPTPLAVVQVFIAPHDQAAVEPAYEARLLQELDEITAAVPHSELAIQWDVAVEFGILEGVWQPAFGNIQPSIVARLVRIGQRVPADVELGYHLCYGDYGHRHFKQPEDTGKLVEIANAVSAAVTRPIQWIHLPVPRDRSDDAYFTPLQHLKLQRHTQLYLGLAHYTDGEAGARQRIAVAQKFVPDFGISTECGMGRRQPETIRDLLRIHAAVAG